MKYQSYHLNLDRSKKEIKPHGTNSFQCAGYRVLYKDMEPHILPWHWHEELEITHVVSGQIALQLPGQTLHLSAGSTAVINSGILHAAHGEPYGNTCAFVFDPTFITGSIHSVFAEKYLTPLTACADFQIFQSDSFSDPFKKAFEAFEAETPGFEFIVREQLSSVCFQLYTEFSEKIKMLPKKPSQDTLRIRIMIDFIHENYMNHIDIAQIAQTVNISERECLRCFQRTIHSSPGQYLLRHRITQAASMLLTQPDLNVAQIATACGFESPSNFTQNFKRYFKYTPREYRLLVNQNQPNHTNTHT